MKKRHEQLKNQTIHLTDSQSRARKVISIINGLLPFAVSEPVTAQIADNEKVQLKGPNGSGKSSWLRALLGNLSLLDGEIKVNTPLFYLDQHFGVVQDDFEVV